jgi:hypothetical protein
MARLIWLILNRLSPVIDFSSRRASDGWCTLGRTETYGVVAFRVSVEQQQQQQQQRSSDENKIH